MEAAAGAPGAAGLPPALLPQLVRTGCPGFHVNHPVRSRSLSQPSCMLPTHGLGSTSPGFDLTHGNIGRAVQDRPECSPGVCTTRGLTREPARGCTAWAGVATPCCPQDHRDGAGMDPRQRGRSLCCTLQHPPVNLLVGFQGYLGVVCIEPLEREMERQACREAGRQTDVQNQNYREVAFCSLGKYLMWERRKKVKETPLADNILWVTE